MELRNYNYLGTTQSLCPECLQLIPAKIIVRQGRVYFRKTCTTHGAREDFVCSDVNFYDRLEYTVPAKSPVEYGLAADRGCPYDCGLCDEHEQHTCIGLVELTSSCNLTCPMCYASSGPGGKHVSVDDCQRAIDRLVAVEGRPEVLQLSGGEPTTHPRFTRILEYALAQPIDYVQINTNGIRFARDPKLVEALAGHRQRLEVFFQLDGLNDEVSVSLRGEPLLNEKLRALELLGKADLHVTLGNGLCFTRPQARDLILQYLGRQGCCRGQCAPGETGPAGGLPVIETGSDGCAETDANSQAFFDRVLAEQIGATDLFRITITSFLDAYNFDVRRLMKCCTHHILPSGHVIPFCAYNTLYRPGHVPLPELTRTSVDHAAR